MERRFGWIVGAAVFLLVLTRLGRLVESGPETPRWGLVMAATAILGALVVWTTTVYRIPSWVRWAGLGLGVVFLVLRLTAADTLLGGVIPTAETWDPIIATMGEAIAIIRHGSAPVYPTPGMVAVLAVLAWLIGAAWGWHAGGGSVSWAVIPSAVFYLQLSISDPRPSGVGWMIALGIAMTAILGALAGQRGAPGRARDSQGRPLARRSRGLAVGLGVTLVVSSIAVASSGSSLVPDTGTIQWRSGSFGFGSGGISFNRLAGLQQQLVRPSNREVFRARIEPGGPPSSILYWRLETLDTFDGTFWRSGVEETSFVRNGAPGYDPAEAFGGTTTVFSQTVRIDALRQRSLPVAGIPTFITSPTHDTSRLQSSDDGSIFIQPNTSEGMEYEVIAALARPDLDLQAMATRPDGTLSPLFEAAADQGVFSPVAGARGQLGVTPLEVERYLDLPSDLPSEIGILARRHTLGATTSFERAVLLESWFRDSGEFTYSTDVTSGHTALDLAEWLSDPDSRNFRTGYCEQYAAALAVMARALRIPSRVVLGFTPGTQVTQTDGSQAVVVTDKNAHAWTELWIDGFGWVQFDATPRSDGVNPATSAALGFDPAVYVPPPTATTGPFTGELPFEVGDLPGELGDLPFGASSPGSSGWIGLPLWILILMVGALAAASVPIAKRVRRRYRLARVRDGDITAAWSEIVDQLSDLGMSLSPHLTPLEMAESMDRSLIPLAHHYSAAVYGGREVGDRTSEYAAVELWVRTNFDGGRRLRALYNPRSLITRGEPLEN